MVGELCARHGVEHHVIKLELSSGNGVQARARAARYEALGYWLKDRGLDALVTAHHADDQAETLMMRLMRGSGVRGLASMRPIAAVPDSIGLPLLRPLLSWRRFELGEIVAAAGITAADDTSNRDVRFERTRMRAALAASDWLDISALAKSAANLTDADLALDWATDRAYAEVHQDGDTLFWEPATIPRVLGMRVLERIVLKLGRSTPRGAELARWFEALSQGKIATLAGVRGDGTNQVWAFAMARPPGLHPRRARTEYD